MRGAIQNPAHFSANPPRALHNPAWALETESQEQFCLLGKRDQAIKVADVKIGEMPELSAASPPGATDGCFCIVHVGQD